MFYEYFITLLLFKYAFCNDASYGVNVGTVLFTESDNTRKCWSNEELALLRARLVFQDVLPKSSALVMEDDKFVTALVSYFRLSVERVKGMTAGKVQEINLKALTDAIGGYLHHVVIPLGKHSFYAGKISYDSARQLTELCDEMKAYLRTDGHSWTPPIRTVNKLKRATVLSDTAAPGGNPLPRRDAAPPPENAKGPAGACGDLVYSHTPNGPMTVPMPFLDSKTKPTSIAVPFRAFPLRNLQSKSSAFILVRYYETSVGCMKEQNANPADISKFSHDFSAFLDSSILPHMEDEELYPAFGGVLKLKDSLDHGGQAGAGAGAGAGAVAVASPTRNEVPGTGNVPATGNVASSTDANDYYGDEDNSTTIMFAAVAVVILIWIITGVIYCCCRMRRKRREHEKHGARSLSKRGSSRASKPESISSECPTEKKPSKDQMKRASYEIMNPKPCPPGVSIPPAQRRERQSQDKPCKKMERKSGGASVKSPVKKEPQKRSPKPAAKTSPKTAPASKDAKCPKCKQSSNKCGHGLIVGSAIVKGVKSAPVSLKKGGFLQEKAQISSNSQTSAEKPIVFGYDFETSSTDSSSIGDSSSSSGATTPKR